MKNQALFSSKDKSKKLNVVCCNFCLALYGLKFYANSANPGQMPHSVAFYGI